MDALENVAAEIFDRNRLTRVHDSLKVFGLCPCRPPAWDNHVTGFGRVRPKRDGRLRAANKDDE